MARSGETTGAGTGAVPVGAGERDPQVGGTATIARVLIATALAPLPLAALAPALARAGAGEVLAAAAALTGFVAAFAFGLAVAREITLRRPDRRLAVGLVGGPIAFALACAAARSLHVVVGSQAPPAEAIGALLDPSDLSWLLGGRLGFVVAGLVGAAALGSGYLGLITPRRDPRGSRRRARCFGAWILLALLAGLIVGVTTALMDGLRAGALDGTAAIVAVTVPVTFAGILGATAVLFLAGESGAYLGDLLTRAKRSS